jgi:uncharacterized protein (TIGR03067 family)
LAFPFVARSDELAKEKEKLQGTWAVVNLERDGQFQSRDVFAGMTAKFKGDTVTFKLRNEIAFTYTLDMTKEPYHFDMAGRDEKGKELTCRGIFKYDMDGFLILCYNNVSTERRPKEFKTGRQPELSSFSLYVLKRVDP